MPPDEANVMSELQSTNLSRKQIYELAEKFAERTSYTPGVTDIIEYVEQKLHGKIQYTDIPKDSVGGSISVTSRENFTIFCQRQLLISGMFLQLLMS